MILLLDTSTPVCRLTIVDGAVSVTREWHADRDLARGLLRWLREQLHGSNKDLQDITGIGVYQGPGSFTGLRIGLTVMNTMASGLGVPIVATGGINWQQDALRSLNVGNNDKIALPFYDREATITKPRK